MHIGHLHTGKLFQRRTRRQAGSNTAQSLLEGDLQTVGDEGNKDMRFYPLILLMIYRTDLQIVLQFLKDLLQFGEPALRCAHQLVDWRRMGARQGQRFLGGDATVHHPYPLALAVLGLDL